ncbi:hypothetical protein INT48_003672 [Thamnidium elegans]|uniref:Uncharacterized protein n=1 Tax=Thamnidium elegans TaxID=101142 RepID=A0A8H7SIK1_9FUNG|nr:hypothetical protein INT48_003672 [Thamnidium elegans]
MLMKLITANARPSDSNAIGLLLDQEKAYDRVHPDQEISEINENTKNINNETLENNLINDINNCDGIGNEPINTISDIPIDYSKITGSVATNLNNNSEDVSFNDLSNSNTNTSKIMTKKLLELMKYSNDLIIEVFSIVNNNNPKMAIKKLNKYNNNYKHVLEIPSKATKINDELIELIDNFNI